MQSLFAKVSKSTGATIISASVGSQFAFERCDLKNCVFIYSLFEAIEKNGGERIVQLTNGMQKLTLRNENIPVDWSL